MSYLDKLRETFRDVGGFVFAIVNIGALGMFAVAFVGCAPVFIATGKAVNLANLPWIVLGAFLALNLAACLYIAACAAIDRWP